MFRSQIRPRDAESVDRKIGNTESTLERTSQGARLFQPAGCGGIVGRVVWARMQGTGALGASESVANPSRTTKREGMLCGLPDACTKNRGAEAVLEYWAEPGCGPYFYHWTANVQWAVVSWVVKDDG
jgi:hypothetical protein